MKYLPRPAGLRLALIALMSTASSMFAIGSVTTNPSSASVGFEGGTDFFTAVSSSADWVVESDADWLEVTSVSSNGTSMNGTVSEDVLYYSVAPNFLSVNGTYVESLPRSASLMFSSVNGTPYGTFDVMQGGGNPAPNKAVGSSPNDGALFSNPITGISWVDPGAKATWTQIVLSKDGSVILEKWIEKGSAIDPSGSFPKGASSPFGSDESYTVYFSSTAPLASGSYTWSIVSWNELAQVTSDEFTFTIDIPLPGKVAGLGVSGVASEGDSTTLEKPTFSWSSDPNATWYFVWLNRNGTTYKTEWVQGATSYQFPDALPAGEYEFWVRAWNSEGYAKDWSDGFEFTRDAQLPTNVTPVSPVGGVEVSSATPFMQWSGGQYSTWSQLWVNKGSSVVINPWIEGDELSGVAAPSPLSYGSYTWWVRAWNPDGETPWSSSADFTFGKPAPTYAGGILSWDAIPGSTWYRVWINDSNGGPVFTPWVKASDLSDPNNPSYDLGSELSPGSYTAWVQSWSATKGALWSDSVEITVGAP